MALHLAIVTYCKDTGFRGTKLMTSALSAEAVIEKAEKWVATELPEQLRSGARVSYGGSTVRDEERRG